jgi:hypothetical protein
MTFLARLSLFLIFILAAGLAAASNKKGIGISNLEARDRLEALNVAWYYTWKPIPIKGAPADKFVPMVWGGGRVDKEMQELRSRGKVPVLLALNEPDHKRAVLSVEDAVKHWPELMAMTSRISSPAPAKPGSPWLERFMSEAKQKNLKVDFVAVHIYSPPNAKRFLRLVDGVHERYRMPIWITEFSVADYSANKTGKNRFSEQDVLRFMREVLPELERRSYVERYAWFGAGQASQEHVRQHSSRLFNEDGSLTQLGRFYAQFQ